MATLAPHGRIRIQDVEEKIHRLKTKWQRPEQEDTSPTDTLSFEQIAEIAPFDRPQLTYAIKICHESKTLSEAGRKLFAVSREKKSNRPNDADRLRKYLAKFELTFAHI
jgi:transcriptional regulatory protein RtcR